MVCSLERLVLGTEPQPTLARPSLAQHPSMSQDGLLFPSSSFRLMPCSIFTELYGGNNMSQSNSGMFSILNS